MSLTYRETNRFFFPVGLWAILTLVATIAGPFGTFEQLTVLPRGVYWAGMIGLAVAGDCFVVAKFPVTTYKGRIIRRLAYLLLYCLILYAVNSVVFDGWYGFGFLLYGFGLVIGIGIATEFLVLLVRKAFQSGAAPLNINLVSEAAEQSPFLQRLPHEKRGALIRIEAQDHYLNVVTNKGAELILMRMSDAERELGEALGLRVHRSHWVASDAVRELRKDKGRHLLVMSDDTEIAVSRSYLKVVKAAEFPATG